MRAVFGLPAMVAGIRHATIDLPSDSYNVWIPFEMKAGFVQYFNPEENRVVDHLPYGAKAISKKPALLQGDGDAAIPPELESVVTDEQGEKCSPYATWKCDHLVCEQNCRPECEQPVCQTRCADTDFSTCQLKCDEHPTCSTYCPHQQPCNTTNAAGEPDCQQPACDTHCGDPVCHLQCGQGAVNCKPVCADPVCSWKCDKPDECPHPNCTLEMTTAHCSTKSGTDFDLPGVKTGEQVMNQFKAETVDYEVGPWSKCDCKTGQIYRDVSCPDDLLCGDGHPPASSMPCPKEGEHAVTCPPQWDIGEWSHCKGTCATNAGEQHRNVTCVNGFCDGADEPATTQACTYKGDYCKTCEATLFDGEFFNGWNKTLVVGDYNKTRLQAGGVDIKDVSSIDVYGFCCVAELFEHSDFNVEEADGWSVRVQEGRLQAGQLAKQGFVDGQTKSVKVYQDKHCVSNGAGAAFGGLTAILTMALVALW